MMRNVQTFVRTPEQFVKDNARFTIPSYQRPYVWSDEAIKGLFDDLYSAFTTKLEHYFVGTILTAERNGVLELIDGQQRTTSLMLFALACKKKSIPTALTNLICVEDSKTESTLRLSFKIRVKVQTYLGHMAGIESYENQYPGESEVKSNPYLKRLAGGLATFENLLDQLPYKEQSVSLEELQKQFADYVFSHMKMVENRIPSSMDLNQLFSTMNNSGVQLEQADILKSLLLKKISNNKATYNAIWQACENMDNYFERNVRKVFPSTKWADLNNRDFSAFDGDIFQLKQEDDQRQPEAQGMTISQIAQSIDLLGVQGSKDEANKKNEDDDEVYCHSIISFPQLLLHAYRIFLNQKGNNDFLGRFHSDRLIEIFKPIADCEEGDIKAFIETLWQVRFAFDLWVVKWVERADEDERHLILCNVSKSQSNGNNYFNRSPLEHSEIPMLQMVRHFTADRNAQYWLTPFLGWLVENKPRQKQRAEVLTRLEKLDNQLSLAVIDQKSASYTLLQKDLASNQKQADGFIQSYLSELNGVQFRHYWFQKLEYLLWKHYSDYLGEKGVKYKRYRIISRNSVEHVHPQNDEYGVKLQDGYLDSFGNLALLNVGQNSAYSNQSVGKKREDFFAKPQYDSLKLKHIYDLIKQVDGQWDEAKISTHQEKMIELLENHYR